MAFLTSAVDVAAPGGVWEWFIINVFGFIANYGWRIVVFVALLKLVLSPLDFYQRYKMRKNQRITEQLKPQMDKIEKQYGSDKAALQRKQMEISKNAGFSYMYACLPLIITLVLFITFFTALRTVSTYMEFRQYVYMYDSYVTSYEDTGFDFITRNNEKRTGGRFVLKDTEGADYTEIDNWLSEMLLSDEKLDEAISSSVIADDFKNNDIVDPKSTLKRYKTEYIDAGKSYKDFVNDYKGKWEDFGAAQRQLPLAMSIFLQIRAQEATVAAFKENRPSFLWIKSIWVADVPWSSAIPEWGSFKTTMSSIKKLQYLDWNTNPGKVYEDSQTMFLNMANEDMYNIVTAKVREDDSLNKNNGYLVLVVFVIGLSFLSQFISSRQQKKSGQNMDAPGMGAMKIMMWVLPIMLAVFALTSSSAFTIYMVVNSAMSLLINLIMSLIVNKIFGTPKATEASVIKYGRADPHEKQERPTRTSGNSNKPQRRK